MSASCRRGLFITFEGVDGVGKTTQAQRLRDYLSAQGLTVVMTREPGGTPLGEAIRRLLLDPSAPHIGKRAEALLYSADRAEHVADVIRPALERGECVISDRYTDSFVGYQGGGRELSRRDIERLNEWATDGLQPDRTYLLDMAPTAKYKYLEKTGHRCFAVSRETDRLEAEPNPFQNRARQVFLDLADHHPDRIAVIDASRGIDEVWSAIRTDVDALLATRKIGSR